MGRNQIVLFIFILEMSYNLKSIKEEFKKNGVFYTPPELALYLKNYIPENITEVYDPTCGDGGLLSVFPDEVKKYGQELNPEQLEVAKQRLVNFEWIAGDTLKNPAFMDHKFEAIVANPPFSVAREPHTDQRREQVPALPPKSKADYAFLLHILHLLSPTGTAVVLNFPGILYRGNAEGKIRQRLLEQGVIKEVRIIPGKQFVDTPIATVLLVLQKNRNENTVTFSEWERSIIIPLEQIAENWYNLTVSQYLPEEKEEIPPVDPHELERKSRQGFLSLIVEQISFSKTIAELEGREWRDFCDEIIKVAQDIKNQRPTGKSLF